MLGQARKNFAVQVGLVGPGDRREIRSHALGCALTLRSHASQPGNPAVPGNFSVLGEHEKRKEKIARAARAARRRRAAGAERRRAVLRRLSRYPFCASFQFLRGSTLPAALTMSMPLGSRRPRDGVRPRAVRRSCAAPRRRRSSARATAGRRRRRCTRRTGLTRDAVSTAEPRRRRPSACVRELAEDFEDVEDARDVLEHVDGRPSGTA